MMYSEFVENTSCKDTEYNRTVFKRLEIIYMSDDSCTKEWVYEAGKKLVDNSLTEEQKAHNERVRKEIKENEISINKKREEVRRCAEDIKIEKEGLNDEWYIKYLKSNKTQLRKEIRELETKNKILKESIIK